MLIRPPYGDHAAWPVSSYNTTSTFGAPCGALFDRNAGQSAVESRTSSLISPWNGRVMGVLSGRQAAEALAEDLDAEHHEQDHHDHGVVVGHELLDRVERAGRLVGGE